jgi:hypothetical protein
MLVERKYNVLTSVALVAVLGMPSFAAFADSANDVTGRNADAIQRDYGRAGGDMYWEYRQERNVPGPVVKALEEARDIATEPPSVWPPLPQRYGRAGGYLELERLQAQSPHG